MTTSAADVLDFVRENDVQFVRLGFCDILGTQKSIAIMADELPSAFTTGVSFDANAIKGFGEATRSDLLLFPDPQTLTVLPWRPGPGRVAHFLCSVHTPDGSVCAQDSRQILQRIVQRAAVLGYVCKIGTECEFYLFRTDDDGQPAATTLDQGGYLDIAPLDKGEDIRREICLTLEEMGIEPETSHHEQGPGQNEIDFRFSEALTAADQLQRFKSVVKTIAARNGLFASFLPKPLPDAPGSGLHINLSLAQNGQNIFRSLGEGHSAAAESFIAGVLAKTPELTLLLNPLINSYARLGAFEAPRYISWSHQNRSQLIRIPAAKDEKVRMELRSPDPATNPYLAFSLVIAAGLDGIEAGLALPPAVDADLFSAGDKVTELLTRLPSSLPEAIALARESALVQRVLGPDLFARFIALKEAEVANCAAAADSAAYSRDHWFRLI